MFRSLKSIRSVSSSKDSLPDSPRSAASKTKLRRFSALKVFKPFQRLSLSGPPSPCSPTPSEVEAAAINKEAHQPLLVSEVSSRDDTALEPVSDSNITEQVYVSPLTTRLRVQCRAKWQRVRRLLRRVGVLN